jgi:tripartite ATP-independent transporter DctM subunit
MAGIIPGLTLAGLFMLIILVMCIVKPQWGGATRHASMSDRFSKLVYLVPVLVLFGFIMGSIYTGWATPTEAAALGTMAAILMAWGAGGLSWKMVGDALEGTMRTTAMIMLILVAANFLNFVLSSLRLTDQLLAMIAAMDLTPMQTLFVIIGFYFILGFFIETLSLMIITIPIVAPLMIQLGFDPVWFGIVLIVLIEMALITPPVGLNLFVVQSVRQRGTLMDVVVGAIPFVIAMFVMVLLLVAFPQIALLLPQMTTG